MGVAGLSDVALPNMLRAALLLACIVSSKQVGQIGWQSVVCNDSSIVAGRYTQLS